MLSSSCRDHTPNRHHQRRERELQRDLQQSREPRSHEGNGREHGRELSRDTIVLLGGMGGLEARYRAAAEEAGYTLRYYEQRGPASPMSGQRVAAVIVVVTMVSHPLMVQARKLAGEHAPVVYLKSHSVSALRQALQQTTAARGQRTERQVA